MRVALFALDQHRASGLVHVAAMSQKLSKTADTRSSTDPVGNIADMSQRLSLSPVPAAWPTGVSQLAQAIEACQRCDTAVVCTDWLNRAPSTLNAPPAFCPNADELKHAKKIKVG